MDCSRFINSRLNAQYLAMLSSNLLNEVGSLFSILKYVRYRRKKFTFAISSPDEFLLLELDVMSLLL